MHTVLFLNSFIQPTQTSMHWDRGKGPTSQFASEAHKPHVGLIRDLAECDFEIATLGGSQGYRKGGDRCAGDDMVVVVGREEGQRLPH